MQLASVLVVQWLGHQTFNGHVFDSRSGHNQVT